MTTHELTTTIKDIVADVIDDMRNGYTDEEMRDWDRDGVCNFVAGDWNGFAEACAAAGVTPGEAIDAILEELETEA